MRKLLVAIFTISIGTCFGQSAGVDLTSKANLLSFISNYEAAFETKDSMLLESLLNINGSSSFPRNVFSKDYDLLQKYRKNSLSYIRYLKPQLDKAYRGMTDSKNRAYSLNQYQSFIKHLQINSTIFHSKLGSMVNTDVIKAFDTELQSKNLNLENAFSYIPRSFDNADEKYNRKYQESLVMNDFIRNFFYLAEDDLASHFMYYHALANMTDDRLKWQANAYQNLVTRFCRTTMTDIAPLESLGDSNNKDSIYQNTCQTRLHPAVSPHLYVVPDSLDIAAKKLNEQIRVINSNLTNVYLFIRQSLNKGRSNLADRVMESSEYIELIAAFTNIAKKKQGSLLLSESAKEQGLIIHSIDTMIDYVKRNINEDFFFPLTSRKMIQQMAISSKHAMEAIKKDLDTLENRSTIAINTIIKTKSAQTVSTSYDSYLHLTERLVRVYPHIAGKLVSQNADRYSYLVLSALKRISIQGRNQYLFNTTIKWGCGIVGTGLLLTGVGSGVGAVLIGAGTATSTTLAGVATASFTAGTVVGAISTAHHVGETYNRYNDMKDYSRSALSGNEHAIQKYDKAVQEYYDARTAAAIELGFSAVDLGALKIFGKVFKGSSASEDISRMSKELKKTAKEIKEAGHAAPTLTGMAELEERIIKEAVDDTNKYKYIAHSASEYAQHLLVKIKNLDDKIVSANVDLVGAKNKMSELERFQQSMLDIAGESGHYLGYKIAKNGDALIVPHRAISTTGNFNKNAMKEYMQEYWSNFTAHYPIRSRRFYKRTFGFDVTPDDIHMNLIKLQEDAYQNVLKKSQNGHYKLWRGPNFKIDHIEFLAEYNFLIMKYLDEASGYPHYAHTFKQASQRMKELNAERFKLIEEISSVDPEFNSGIFR